MENLTEMKTRIKKLNSQFISLNKKYVKLDNSWKSCLTEDQEFILSFKLEDVQSEMTKVSTELEPLENLYELKHNEVIARILNM
jgi:hypothetical protein